MIRVMVFGTFDGVHEGHRHLLSQAAEKGEEVIAVLTRDEHVLELKGHLPKNMIADRLEMIQYESEINIAVKGDAELGTYGVVKEHNPSIILLGYDQDDLRDDLKVWLKENGRSNIMIEQASPYKEELFSSSLINSMDEEMAI